MRCLLKKYIFGMSIFSKLLQKGHKNNHREVPAVVQTSLKQVQKSVLRNPVVQHLVTRKK